MIPTAGAPALSPEELERTERIDRLSAQGGGGIPSLVAMLDDPSWTVRRAVVAALSAAGTPAIRPLCHALVSSRDSETRIAAVVDALSAVGGDADGELEQLVANEGPAVVADVAQILGRRRASGSVPLTLLARLARHSDDNVAVAAIEALGRIGGRAAVDTLVDCVRSENFFRVFPAIDVLGRSGDPRAVAPLTKLLEQPQYASEAARALGHTGDRAAIPSLARLLARSTGALVRLGALALTDLRHRHLERYGSVDVVDIDEAIGAQLLQPPQREAGESATVRNLLRVLPEGDVQEQASICFLLGLLGDPSAGPALGLLLGAVPPVGPASAEALRRLGRKADVQIAQGIATGNNAEKRWLLGLVSHAGATDDVVACLGDPDPDVRGAACEALARIGGTAIVGALFPLLADSNPRVSFAALAAIQSLGCSETELLALSAARSPDAQVRRAAMRMLAYFGFPAALDVFLDALHDHDSKVREAALQGLPFIEDSRAVDALWEAAKSPLARTRAVAMRAFGQCAGDPRVHGYLLKGLVDLDAWVRYYACQSLGRLAFQPAASALIELLGDPAGQVRVAAVEALSGLKSPVALAALKAATTDADADIQRAALVGLGVAKDLDSLPALLAAARSDDPATRLVALSALAGMKSPDVVGILATAARDPDENVRTAALGFLAAIPDATATQRLLGLLRDAVQPDKILTALATHHGERVPALCAALETADDETAPYLTAALARLRHPDANAALVAAMTMSSATARKATASTLAVLASKEALTALADAAAYDPESEVRQICSLLLAR
ncbi:MAG: HEAT repeat domain-containing protein [Deltaproteobacteria bacterium]|nr:HEAT repeat domain-containing protein [Deltaproteobacteria bacterium]